MELKDRFLLGAFAGLVGSILMYLFIQAFDWTGIIKYGQERIAGDTVFNYRPTLFFKVAAAVITMLFGVFWGVVLSFLFSRVLTPRYFILKGALFGFTLFVVNLGILDEFFKYPENLHDQPVDIMVIAIGYLIYGVATAILIKRLGHSLELKN